MRAGLARLLEHGDRERLAAFLLLQLREPQRRRHPGGPAADDQHVDFEGLANRQWLSSSSSFQRPGASFATSCQLPMQQLSTELDHAP